MTIDLTTNQLLYFQPSTVDRIISEEFIITNDLDNSCQVRSKDHSGALPIIPISYPKCVFFAKFADPQGRT
jgi:hypothetical protein